MNTMDMYTREKAGHNRQADIERHIRTTALLAENRPARTPFGRRWVLAAGGAAVTALLIALMVIAVVSAGSF